MANVKRYQEWHKSWETVKHPCWIKFLHDKYGGLVIDSSGYDMAYEQGLIATVHMQRATLDMIPYGILFVQPDVWPVNRDGRFGIEIALSLKNGTYGRGVKITDVRIEGNSLVIETPESVVTQRYPIDLVKAYTAFLATYGERELMEDDSTMEFEMRDEWKVKLDGSFRGPKRAGNGLPPAP